MRLLLYVGFVTLVASKDSKRKKRLHKAYEQHLKEHDLERPELTYDKGLRSLKKLLPKGGLDFDGWMDLHQDWQDGSAFNDIDKDGDGVIWFQELAAFGKHVADHPKIHYLARKRKKLGADTVQDVAESMLKAANPNGPGLYATKQQFGLWRAREAFNAYDDNENGKISHKELGDILYKPGVLRVLKRMRADKEIVPLFDVTTEQIRQEQEPFCRFHCPRKQSKLEQDVDNERRRLFGASEMAQTAMGTGCQYVTNKTDCEAANEAMGVAVDCGAAVGTLGVDFYDAAKCFYHVGSAAWDYLDSDYHTNSTGTNGKKEDFSCDGNVAIDVSGKWDSCWHTTDGGAGMHTCGDYCCCMRGFIYDNRDGHEECIQCTVDSVQQVAKQHKHWRAVFNGSCKEKTKIPHSNTWTTCDWGSVDGTGSSQCFSTGWFGTSYCCCPSGERYDENLEECRRCA